MDYRTQQGRHLRRQSAAPRHEDRGGSFDSLMSLHSMPPRGLRRNRAQPDPPPTAPELAGRTESSHPRGKNRRHFRERPPKRHPSSSKAFGLTILSTVG